MINEPPSSDHIPGNESPKDSLAVWLQSAPIVALVGRHDHFVKNREVEMGFNLFHLISDVYHRENLHSDMMKAIMSPSGSHGHGDIFLRLFLDFLREKHGVTINAEDYQNAKVVREDGRIDLLIYDNKSRKAIIVENKINGAHDMDRQLVRYLEKATQDNYTCESIVYLCLNQKKHPETPGWTDAELAKVDPLLKVVCAYDDDSKDDLHTGWLTPCINALNSDHADPRLPHREEVAHVLRQYRQLIFKLGRTLMNKPIMEDFYQLMQDKQQHRLALSVADLVSHLPAYRCARVVDRFCQDRRPFHSLYRYPNNSSPLAIFQGVGEATGIKLHVDCSPEGTTNLAFWNNVTNDPKGAVPRRILQEIGMTQSFDEDSESGWFRKQFTFPEQEAELFQFLREFKEALKKHLRPPA